MSISWSAIHLLVKTVTTCRMSSENIGVREQLSPRLITATALFQAVHLFASSAFLAVVSVGLMVMAAVVRR